VEEMRGPFEVLEPTATPGIVSVRPMSLSAATVERSLDDLVEAVARRDDVVAGNALRSVVAGATRPPATTDAEELVARRLRAARRA
jgi:hypothetical protein